MADQHLITLQAPARAPLAPQAGGVNLHLPCDERDEKLRAVTHSEQLGNPYHLRPITG